MKFIIDAQLPFRLKKWLLANGYDALHTDNLPKKHLTPDMEIIKFADKENRIVITKDSDFFQHHILHGKPRRILMIITGNIKNRKLLELFEQNFHILKNHFLTGKLIVEINNVAIIVHS